MSEDAAEQLENVYRDRNNIVLLAAKLALEAGYPVSIIQDEDNLNWPVVAIQLPTSQVSWHVPRLLLLKLLDGSTLNAISWDGIWDGHTNEEKERRIHMFVKDGKSAENKMFERVQLLTRDGKWVTTVQVPAFAIPADVLIWGTRTFVLQTNGEYREGMAYAIPVTMTAQSTNL